MAKGKTSFADKALKQRGRKADTRHVRVIRSIKDFDTGAVRFSDRMVAVPADANLAEYFRRAAEEK